MMQTLDSFTVAGAVPGLFIAINDTRQERTGFPFNPVGEGRWDT